MGEAWGGGQEKGNTFIDTETSCEKKKDVNIGVKGTGGKRRQNQTQN